MSTLFDNYYDCLGHELTYGSAVGFRKGKHFIYGVIIDIVSDSKHDYKFIVVPSIGWKGPDEPKLQKRYTVSNMRIFKINLAKKD